MTYKGPPFGFFKIIGAIFKNDLRGLGAAGPYSRCQNIIKLGPKINSDLVSGGPRCPQFLARLTAKLSIVPQGTRGAPGVKIQVSPSQKTSLTKVVRHDKGMIEMSSAPPEELGKPAKRVS